MTSRTWSSIMKKFSFPMLPEASSAKTTSAWCLQATTLQHGWHLDTVLERFNTDKQVLLSSQQIEKFAGTLLLVVVD